MTTTKRELLTADDLFRLHSQGGKGELILGILAETESAGGEHGEIAMTIGAELRAHVRPRRLGRVFGTDADVLLQNGPDAVREPDVAFISAEKLPLDTRNPGYYRVPPDLVAEIAPHLRHRAGGLRQGPHVAQPQRDPGVGSFSRHQDHRRPHIGFSGPYSHRG